MVEIDPVLDLRVAEDDAEAGGGKGQRLAVQVDLLDGNAARAGAPQRLG